MCYASAYMEAYFLLIFPLFFLSRCVSSKPLHHFFLLETTEDMHGSTKRNIDERVSFDQTMTSYAKTTLKQTLLAINDLEKYFQPVPHRKKIKVDTRREDLILETQRNISSVIENNSSEVHRINGVKINHKIYNFSHFYWKTNNNFTSSLPRSLSLNFESTSLGKHNVPFKDVINLTVAQSSHDRAITSANSNKKSFHVADVKGRRSINNDFDLAPPSHQLGSLVQALGRHMGSRKSDLIPDRRKDKTESTKNILLGSLKIVSPAAEKTSMLESENLSSSYEKLRSEGEQLEMRSMMSGVEENDKIKSNNQTNVIYEENMEHDRTEESRRRTFGLDQVVNLPSVQTLEEFTEENWDKSSKKIVDIYDHVEMVREDKVDGSGRVRNGLPWQHDGGFLRFLNARFDNDVWVNTLETSDEDIVNTKSYPRDELQVEVPFHSDQQLKRNSESINTYLNQLKLITFLDGERLFRNFEKKFRKLEKPLSQVNKLRLKTFSYVPSGFEFNTHFKPSGDNQETRRYKIGQRIVNTGADSNTLDKRAVTKSKTSPNYSGQNEKVNLPKEDKTDLNQILNKENAPPNFQFDYNWVSTRKSFQNDPIRKPTLGLARENVPVARNLSKTKKTQAQQHLFRKRRDLEQENSTISLDIITSHSVTEKENSTSFIEVKTTITSVGQSEVVTMETDFQVTEDTDGSRRTFTREEKNSGKVQHF
ncbi:hypothetical protein HOLleu_21742 [Holothuria leucospilota]|uniref:Uncharacterized protein n=1 Tax=Holothuria leucospilota TaxID=206669 RepID=A0A9Q1H476_HOLLE|nr:hypothetical protein HOLleu_21742 [Holothuria leucospilota]